MYMHFYSKLDQDQLERNNARKAGGSGVAN